MWPDWRLIERENEGLTVRTAAGLGEGWSSRVYLVNEELVVKCPKRAEDWLDLDREVSFLQWASDKLPLRVHGSLQPMAARQSKWHFANARPDADFTYGSTRMAPRQRTPRRRETANAAHRKASIPYLV